MAPVAVGIIRMLLMEKMETKRKKAAAIDWIYDIFDEDFLL